MSEWVINVSCVFVAGHSDTRGGGALRDREVVRGGARDTRQGEWSLTFRLLLYLKVMCSDTTEIMI